MSKKLNFNRNEVVQLYFNEKRSVIECSKILGTTRVTLTKWMNENGILIDSKRKHSNEKISFTNKEIEMFKENNIQIYSLGPQVLRAETAVVAILAQLAF